MNVSRYKRQLSTAKMEPEVVDGIKRLHSVNLLFYKRRKYENWGVLFGLIGIGLMCWNTEHLPKEQEHHKETPASTLFKSLISISTVALLYCIHKRYKTRVVELVLTGLLPPSVTLWVCTCTLGEPELIASLFSSLLHGSSLIILQK